jgi:hypothetical protein
VKSIFFVFIAIFYSLNSFSQETIERKNKLSDSVIERFYVFKSDRETRQGPYKAFFRRKTVVASGNYVKGGKTGVWNFYDPEGKLVETFNYDENALTYEAPLDTTSDIVIIFDGTVEKDDVGTKPVKIGGTYYGYIPFVTAFRLPFETFDVNTGVFDAYIELLISPLGRLAEYKVHLISAYYKYNHTVSLDVNLFTEADRTFIPATLNHKPIISRIVIKCVVTRDGLDFE